MPFYNIIDSQVICKIMVAEPEHDDNRYGRNKKNISNIEKNKKNDYTFLFDRTRIRRDNVIAYCGNFTHRGWVNKSLLQLHQCIEKQCPYLEKTNPNYWHNIELAKEKSKALRISKNELRQKIKDRDDYIKSVFRPYTDIYITSIREVKYGLAITYIYDKRVDLSDAIYALRDKFKCGIFLKSVKSSVEIRTLLIRNRKNTDLLSIPGIGKITKQRLNSVGYHFVEDLHGADADLIYEKECALRGESLDRHILRYYRTAVDYAKAHT